MVDDEINLSRPKWLIIVTMDKNRLNPWTPKPWKMKVLDPQIMGYNP